MEEFQSLELTEWTAIVSSLDLDLPDWTRIVFNMTNIFGGPYGTLVVFPPEIRNKIYGHVLEFSAPIKEYLPEEYKGLYLWQARNGQKPRCRTGILTASKAVYDEAYPVIFASNRFNLHVSIPSWSCQQYPWIERDGFSFEISLRSSRQTLPPEMREWGHLMKHWRIDLKLAPRNIIDETNSIFPFISHYLKLQTLELILTWPSRKEMETPDSIFDQVLRLRDLERLEIDVSFYFQYSAIYKDLTRDFRNYISNTVKLPAGVIAKPFEGEKYLTYPEEDDDDYPIKFPRFHLPSWLYMDDTLNVDLDWDEHDTDDSSTDHSDSEDSDGELSDD